MNKEVSFCWEAIEDLLNWHARHKRGDKGTCIESFGRKKKGDFRILHFFWVFFAIHTPSFTQSNTIALHLEQILFFPFFSTPSTYATDFDLNTTDHGRWTNTIRYLFGTFHRLQQNNQLSHTLSKLENARGKLALSSCYKICC